MMNILSRGKQIRNVRWHDIVIWTLTCQIMKLVLKKRKVKSVQGKNKPMNCIFLETN